MSQSAEELRATLARLHDQLQQASDLDPEVRRQLAHTTTEIQEALDRDEPDVHEGLLERLSDSARHFEESHPTLFQAVGRVSDLLARIGV